MFIDFSVFCFRILHSCSGSCLASPMKMELSIVNTIAWMKHTSTSRVDMKTLIITLTALIPRNTPIGLAATRKMIQTREIAIACPAMMLAKRRIMSANGFVNIPTNSIAGISGNALSAKGTSGQNISFQ